MQSTEIILIITTTLAGLMAGLFYSFTFSVMPGLRKLSDTEFIITMQSINKEIQNPVFFICFFGILICLPLSTFQIYNQSVSGFWLLAATIIYFVGVFGMTIFGNIPLNNSLDKFNVSNQSSSEINKHRVKFERRWNLLNNIRTACSLICFVLVICACILHRR